MAVEFGNKQKKENASADFNKTPISFILPIAID